MEQLNIAFTSFENDTNWVRGVVDDSEYRFTAKLYDEGSVFGIDDGRVSKLHIYNNVGETIVHYDRGWNEEPSTREAWKVLRAVLEFLENAPLTRELSNW